MQQEPEKTQLVNGEATQAFSPQGADVTQLAVTVKCPVCDTLNTAGDNYCSECGFLLTSEPGEFDAPPADEVGAYLVEASSGREFSIRPGRNTIGRQDSDILLTDASVSRSHAIICDEGGAFYLEDLGSTNGTFVNGGQVAKGERAELASGAQIKFGSVIMEFRAPGAPEPPLVEPAMETEVGTDHPEMADIEEGEQVSAPPPAAPEAEEGVEEIVMSAISEEFEVKSEVEIETVEPETVEPTVIGRLIAQDGATYDVPEGVTTIGRSGDNDIVIPDPYVSGRHAQITASEEEITLTDLGSTNGTLLDGSQLAKDVAVELPSGAAVQFGKVQFKWDTVE